MRTWIVATAVATAALLLADRRGWNEGRWIAKPLASLGFILVAVAAGATGSEWGRLVLAGLVLGAIGDVLLLPKSDASFTAGLASFLLGHLLFAAAFLVRGVSIPWLLTAAALFVAPALAAWAWLRGRVPPGMGTPVRAYISVISAMV
ncbi:MAG: lysoplasmalogenase family protein, partial [Alphaproteobacteria bacterium]